jgi:hypothetical protein
MSVIGAGDHGPDHRKAPPQTATELETGMEELIATVVQTRRAGRVMHVARILVPGRPVISTRGYDSREAAQANARQRWPTARLVDVDTFIQERLRFRPESSGEFLISDFHPE